MKTIRARRRKGSVFNAASFRARSLAGFTSSPCVRASELGSGPSRTRCDEHSPYVTALFGSSISRRPKPILTAYSYLPPERFQEVVNHARAISAASCAPNATTKMDLSLITWYDGMTMTVSSQIFSTPSSLRVSRRNRISKDMSTTATPTSSRPTYSCIRCAERKVKCDRQKPCSACVKHNVDCAFNINQPPRKRHKRVQILTDRLKHYEALLQEQGINANQLPDTPSSGHDRVPNDTSSTAPEVQLQTPSSIDSDPAQHPARYQKSQVVHGQGRSKFVEK